MHLLSGEVWKPGCCTCHDYGKGGDRRDETGKGEVCKIMLTILFFFYNMGGCIMKVQDNYIMAFNNAINIFKRRNA